MIKVTIKKKDFPFTRIVTKAESMDEAIKILARHDDKTEYTFENYDDELDEIDVDWEQVGIDE